jgi:Domain of unknown function (DUF4440)
MLSLRIRRWVAAALPFVALWFVSAPLMAQAAPSVSTPLSRTDLAALEVIRKDVWVHWFTGDTAQLRRVLAPELVAISADAPHWQTLDETIAGSAKFKAGGGRFVSVTFESNTVHHFRDVVVMFSHYAVVTERAGTRATQKGLATEVFVRTNGRWVHTSWQLDSSP